MALVALEGLVMSFWLLLVCVVGIADGPVGLVCLYEQDVQQRAVELGLTTKEDIRRRGTAMSIALFVPVLVVVPAMVYGINGARGFWEGFVQMTAILLIMNLFDRLFVDWWWVARTKAWLIPGTEDLMPYIPRRAVLKKWVGTMVGFPILAAILAGAMLLVPRGSVAGLSIDYGSSEIYTQADMDEAIRAIEREFSGWRGCELHSLTYAGDECMNEETVEWMRTLSEGRGGRKDYVQCIEFVSDFHSPKEGGGAWEADEEYTGWSWWLGRTEGGSWDLLTWGY